MIIEFKISTVTAISGRRQTYTMIKKLSEI